MLTGAFRHWFCLAAALCVVTCAQAAERGRLFDDPERDAFAQMRRRAHEELELERAIEREGRLDTGDAEADDLLPEERPIRSRRSEIGRPPPRRHASGPPAVGFFNRSAALTISWFTAPLRFEYRDWKTATVFTTIPLVLILSGFDDKTFNLLTKHHTPSKDRIAERVDRLGEVPIAAGVLAGFGAYGLVFDDSRGIHTLEAGVIATALAGGLTTALKYATGRTRPTAGVGSKQFEPFGGEMSFPSGHTTVAFTLAGVINYHYPGWIGRVALLGACGTAWARVYNLHHWPTDVIYAAMISSATAHYVSKMNLAAAHGDLTFEPVFDSGGGGLAVRRKF